MHRVTIYARAACWLGGGDGAVYSFVFDFQFKTDGKQTRAGRWRGGGVRKSSNYFCTRSFTSLIFITTELNTGTETKRYI